MSVRILADSTCDLTEEQVKQYGVEIVPLYIMEGEKSYRDRIDITRDELFRRTENEKVKFSTAAVNVEDYMRVFSEIRAQGDEIVHFTISSEMSSCYQNACLAAQEVGGVKVVDSRNLSSGIALLVLDAAEMASEGKSAQEIFDMVEKKKERLDVSFVIDTMDYLVRGGRCSALAAFGANLLSLKPCIEVKNGKMGVGKKYRGNIERCMIRYIKERLADVDTLELKRIFYTDSGIEKELEGKIVETIRECAPFAEIIHGHAGCTISNHCGPGTMGVLFYRK